MVTGLASRQYGNRPMVAQNSPSGIAPLPYFVYHLYNLYSLSGNG